MDCWDQQVRRGLPGEGFPLGRWGQRVPAWARVQTARSDRRARWDVGRWPVRLALQTGQKAPLVRLAAAIP
jgi:hypothetical protein